MARLLRLGFLLPVVAGIVLLVVAEFSPLYEIRAMDAVPAGGGPFDAGPHHGYALLIIAAGAALMTFGAVRGRSRPACAALLALGIAALFVCLAIDYPDVGEEGVLAERYELAKASPRIGFYLETLGSVLLLVGAAGLLLFTRRDRDERPAPAA